VPASNVVWVTEQSACLIPQLDLADAKCLEALGRELRGIDRPGGGSDGDESPEEDRRSSLKVTRSPNDDGWSLTVRNSIGVIGVGDLQIMVQPKIAEDHFVHLVALALEPDRVRLGKGTFLLDQRESYLPSVWQAFLDALTATLRSDLHHEYDEQWDAPPYIRGRLDVPRSALNLGRGRLAFPSTFEELSVDNPVNRILRAACLAVSNGAARVLGPLSADTSPFATRYRAIHDLAVECFWRLGEAGDLRPADLEAVEPRLAVHQERALTLGRHVLGGIGRRIKVGDRIASCFLQATPPIVEAGIRNLLNIQLGSGVSVSKESRQKAEQSFIPDLVVTIDGIDEMQPKATGDVKYRIRKETWPRSVLEQAVTFAEVLQADQSFFVDFATADSDGETKSIKINERKYHRVSWPARDDVTPHAAAQHVLNECRRLLLEAEASAPTAD